MRHNLKFFIAGILACILFNSSAIAQNPPFQLGRNVETLVNMMRDLSIFYVDEVDPDRLMEDAAEGMTISLDPYTEYISAEDMTEFEIMTTGKYGGIGSLIRQKDDYVYITQPYKGYPADKAGLVPGDKIIEIDGQDAKGIGATTVSSLLKGDPGTALTLKVEKLYTGKIETVTINRERIMIPGVPYYGFAADGIGYIQHIDFTEDCSSELRQAFMELRRMAPLKGVILDYRGNGGGILSEAVKVLSFFLPKGTEVVSMKGKMMENPVVFRTENEPIDIEIPIIVLTGSSSASAAEIVAGALQDLDRAVLVGQRTFGKGLVQATRPLGYNSYLKVTTAKYYIPSGRCIQAIDYAHRNEDGSVGYVPDSLINEFHTRGGRKVYDGGGVMPDEVTNPEYISRFTLLTYGNGYVEDFVDEYMKANPDPVDIFTFKFSDADYQSFIEFMKDKDMEFQSETKLALEALKIRSKRELYYDDIASQIEAIEQTIKDDRESNLRLYQEQLIDLIESNIVLRHHYQEGLTAYKLVQDKEILRAVEILRDPDLYRSFLEKDTERK